MKIVYYDEKAVVYNDQEEDNLLFLGKHVVTDNLERFFLKTSSGSLIDGRNLSKYEIKNLKSIKYTEVTPKVFELYIKYLTFKTQSSLRSIERLLT